MTIRKRNIDIEKNYSAKLFAEKLRRLADCIEENKTFRIQIGGERITVPPHAVINLEHERGPEAEEIEFQIKWRR